MQQPDKYSPALSGFDAVRFADQSELVEGKRAHGVMYHNQIFLFADEAALKRFWDSPEFYSNKIYQAMNGSGAIRR